MLHLVKEDAMLPGRRREPMSNFKIQPGEKIGLPVPTYRQAGYEMEPIKNEDEQHA